MASAQPALEQCAAVHYFDLTTSSSRGPSLPVAAPDITPVQSISRTTRCSGTARRGYKSLPNWQTKRWRWHCDRRNNHNRRLIKNLGFARHVTTWRHSRHCSTGWPPSPNEGKSNQSPSRSDGEWSRSSGVPWDIGKSACHRWAWKNCKRSRAFCVCTCHWLDGERILLCHTWCQWFSSSRRFVFVPSLPLSLRRGTTVGRLIGSAWVESVSIFFIRKLALCDLVTCTRKLSSALSSAEKSKSGSSQTTGLKKLFTRRRQKLPSWFPLTRLIYCISCVIQSWRNGGTRLVTLNAGFIIPTEELWTFRIPFLVRQWVNIIFSSLNLTTTENNRKRMVLPVVSCGWRLDSLQAWFWGVFLDGLGDGLTDNFLGTMFRRNGMMGILAASVHSTTPAPSSSRILHSVVRSFGRFPLFLYYWHFSPWRLYC
jgi:hypothetical protein